MKTNKIWYPKSKKQSDAYEAKKEIKKIGDKERIVLLDNILSLSKKIKQKQANKTSKNIPTSSSNLHTQVQVNKNPAHIKENKLHEMENQLKNINPKEYLSQIFQSSAESGRLLNITEKLSPENKLAEISIGNIPLGVYKKGSRKKKISYAKELDMKTYHDEAGWMEYYDLKNYIADRQNISAMRKRFKDSLELNLSEEEIKNTYLVTLTVNTTQDDLRIINPMDEKQTKEICDYFGCCKDLGKVVAYARSKKKFSKHELYKIAEQTSRRLCEKKYWYKHYEKELPKDKRIMGVLDLTDQFQSSINYLNRKYGIEIKWWSVPELHKCSEPAHYASCEDYKTRSNHDSELSSKECICVWHIHNLITGNIIPKHADHKDARCLTCKFALYHLWPYGLTDIRRIGSYDKNGKWISANVKDLTAVFNYLIKYLSKSWLLMKSEKTRKAHGLIPGMKLLKMFKNAKRWKRTSYAFINKSSSYNEEATNILEKETKRKEILSLPSSPERTSLEKAFIEKYSHKPAEETPREFAMRVTERKQRQICDLKEEYACINFLMEKQFCDIPDLYVEPEVRLEDMTEEQRVEHKQKQKDEEKRQLALTDEEKMTELENKIKTVTSLKLEFVEENQIKDKVVGEMLYEFAMKFRKQSNLHEEDYYSRILQNHPVDFGILLDLYNSKPEEVKAQIWDEIDRIMKTKNTLGEINDEWECLLLSEETKTMISSKHDYNKVARGWADMQLIKDLQEILIKNNEEHRCLYDTYELPDNPMSYKEYKKAYDEKVTQLRLKKEAECYKAWHENLKRSAKFSSWRKNLMKRYREILSLIKKLQTDLERNYNLTEKDYYKQSALTTFISELLRKSNYNKITNTRYLGGHKLEKDIETYLWNGREEEKEVLKCILDLFGHVLNIPRISGRFKGKKYDYYMSKIRPLIGLIQEFALLIYPEFNYTKHLENRKEPNKNEKKIEEALNYAEDLGLSGREGYEWFVGLGIKEYEEYIMENPDSAKKHLLYNAYLGLIRQDLNGSKLSEEEAHRRADLQRKRFADTE